MNGAVITGLGPVSAVGSGCESFWNALVEGRSGTRRLTRCAALPNGCAVAAEVDDPAAVALDCDNPKPRAVQLGLAAAQLAFDDARLHVDPERFGVVVGTGLGNVDLAVALYERLNAGSRLAATSAFRLFPHAAACEIACRFDARGPIETVTSGCNSGADALGRALDWIRLGRADAVLVGGTEAELVPYFLMAMDSARALAVAHNRRPEAASRPFDRQRDGNIPGEGAAFVVLESREHARLRGAPIRADLLGFANRATGHRRAYDPFDPVLDPATMVRTMKAALDDAAVLPSALSAICANGSSSTFYDPLEAEAITQVLGPSVHTTPVYSIKGALGQTGAVSSALQAVAAALTIQHGLIPRTVNLDDPDPRCPLNHVTQLRSNPVTYVLANAIGFGGFYYSAMVFGRPSMPG